MKIKKTHLDYIGFVIPLILALLCLISAALSSQQASLPTPMPQEFIGEYSYDGETWLPLTEDADISALKGDLMLRGTLAREMRDGWRLNFYRNHIGISIKLNGQVIYMDSMVAIPELSTNLFASMCAREWMFSQVPGISTEDILEITLHNPHVYGNKSAYRDFLDTLCSDPVGWNLLEANLDAQSSPLRVIGILTTVASMMLLGAAFAALITHVPVVNMLLKLGFMSFFTGVYIIFDCLDVSYWSGLNVLNTYTYLLCMMLAVFCLGQFASDSFSGKKRRTAKIALLLSALLDSILITLSFTGVTALYNTLPYWALSQFILCPLLIFCCAAEAYKDPEKRFIMISALLIFVAVLMDLGGVGSGLVLRSPCSKIAFCLLFLIHNVAAVRSVVANHRASIRAAKLEQELENSRISIMLSQIKPHFLYNVLNTIYHLYRKEPERAQEAVNSFAEYLRCNMLSIEKNEPVLFSEEYQHIKTYLALEQLRFPDRLQVIYDVELTAFKLPPLTIEPLVENAVKHGIAKKRGGGTVTIATRKTADAYLVSVSDTGRGFDVDNYMNDGKPHVGIRNVTDRLQRMVGGSLSITSSEEGTVALVSIPIKEANSK